MKAGLLASACAAAIVATVAPAEAQEVPTVSDTQERAADEQAADQAAPAQGNEVIVTATRRAERLQDVPLSVTAFSQEQLNDLGIVGFEGIAQNTPGSRRQPADPELQQFHQPRHQHQRLQRRPAERGRDLCRRAADLGERQFDYPRSEPLRRRARRVPARAAGHPVRIELARRRHADHHPQPGSRRGSGRRRSSISA